MSKRNSTSIITPLFIPLKAEFYEAFKNGTKDTEHRLFGPRWNERTCYKGRPVVLSLGYGKKHRMVGIVESFTISIDPTKTEAWEKCYGNNEGQAACIKIKLHKADLFQIPEVLSPRLAWLKKHDVKTEKSGIPDDWIKWTAWSGDSQKAIDAGAVGSGETEADAIACYARVANIPLWNEEGFKK